MAPLRKVRCQDLNRAIERIKQTAVIKSPLFYELLKINDTELTQKRSPVVFGPSGKT
jgi:hypothetical protein